MRSSGVTLEEIRRLFKALEESKSNDSMQILIDNEMCKQFQDIIETIVSSKDKKDKEIERLNNKYNKALELLTDFNMPCEMAQNKIPDSYCEENCDVDDESYKKCWDKYIELELKEGEE